MEVLPSISWKFVKQVHKCQRLVGRLVVDCRKMTILHWFILSHLYFVFIFILSNLHFILFTFWNFCILCYILSHLYFVTFTFWNFAFCHICILSVLYFITFTFFQILHFVTFTFSHVLHFCFICILVLFVFCLHFWCCIFCSQCDTNSEPIINFCTTKM